MRHNIVFLHSFCVFFLSLCSDAGYLAVNTRVGYPKYVCRKKFGFFRQIQLVPERRTGHQKSNRQVQNLASVADKRRRVKLKEKRYKTAQPKGEGEEVNAAAKSAERLDIALWPSSRPSSSSAQRVSLSRSHFIYSFWLHPHPRLAQADAQSLAVSASLFAHTGVTKPLIVDDIDNGILLFLSSALSYIYLLK